MKKTHKIITLLILFVVALAKAQITVNYTYDNLNRLTQASYPNGVGIQYTYDALGNRTQEAKTSTLSVEEIQNNNSIKLYPNPFSDKLFIITANQKIKQINLFDLSGKLVIKKEVNDVSDYQLEASVLTSGIYIISILTDKSSESYKVIKK
ncbi:YD repeat-containing protein [Chryseobacterium defluvii]|uniref:YD repeat-containing protein n=1 Tax=Chryseobacterium defluvii TaxID=160396 RepID=A0A840KJA9_9FLAO|nr:RHS repeat domain-containing protein [Chryseobacterium defluvii]MBB4807593.1 YD repeat-containing protein [Chryseobacterium defluvii]